MRHPPLSVSESRAEGLRDVGMLAVALGPEVSPVCVCVCVCLKNWSCVLECLCVCV